MRKKQNTETQTFYVILSESPAKDAEVSGDGNGYRRVQEPTMMSGWAYFVLSMAVVGTLCTAAFLVGIARAICGAF